jgi:hypothetical protein
MLGRTKAALGAVAVALILGEAKPAHALQDSTRGPFYVQGVALGLAIQSDIGNGAYWHNDVEFGWHPSGRHDGFVIGVRQGFDIGNCSVGETVARIGYDIALPLKNGRFELTIAPYGVAGINYVFPCGFGGSTEAGFRFGGGVEVKFFLYKGLYLLARPVETTGEQFIDAGRVFFHFTTGIGIGFAF